MSDSTTPGLFRFAESPIEKSMTLALFVVSFKHGPVEDFMFWPQVNFGKYRADFVVGYKGYMVVVECDGHEWHDKTKEQAARDKARDRWFLSQGFPVMRFTGSEIHRDPIACAEEVADHVVAHGFL